MHATLDRTVKLAAASLVLAACSIFPATASAQVGIGVTIGQPPPPIRYERRPPMPGQGYIWQDGYWGVSRGRYVWVPGLWQQAPYQGAYWSHPHYDHYQDGWRMHEGHWDREDHGDHYDEHRGGDNRGGGDDRGRGGDDRGRGDNRGGGDHR